MLSHKEEIIASELAKGASNKQAYMKAYPKVTITSADAGASRYMKEHPQVVLRAIDLVRTTTKMTLPEVLDVVAKGTEAYYENKEGKQLPDFTNRLEASKLLLRLHGELQDRDTKTHNLTQLNVNIVNDIGIDKLRQLIQEVKDMESKEDDVMSGEVIDIQKEGSPGTNGDGVG